MLKASPRDPSRETVDSNNEYDSGQNADGVSANMINGLPALFEELQLAFQDSELRFRTLVDTIPAIILIIQDDRIRSANPAAVALTGYPAEELFQKSLWDLVKPEYKDVLQRHIDSKDVQPMRNIELTLETKDGKERVLEISGGSISYDCQPAWFLSGFDVTGRVIAEEALQNANRDLRLTERNLLHTNELFERVFASIDILIAYLDSDFNFLRVNRVYAEADHKEPAYFLGKNHFDLYPNAENQAIFAQVVATGQPFYVYEKAFVYKDAPERGVTYWDWSLQPIKDAHGEVQGVVLSLIDVTNRKRAEDRVRQGAKRSETLARISRQLVEAGPHYDAVVEAVVNSVASDFSGACILMLASDDGELLNRVNIHHLDKIKAEDLEKIIAGHYAVKSTNTVFSRVFQTGEAELIQPNGVQDHDCVNIFETYSNSDFQAWNSVLVVPLRLPVRNIGILVVMRRSGDEMLTNEDKSLLQNIADQASLALVNAQLYQDLERALQVEKEIHSQLLRAEKHSALSRMVASVAHELNNPVQTIQNCLYLTQQDLFPDSPIQEYLEMALSETQRVARLIAQLRSIYRANQPEASQPVDLLQLMADCKVLLQPHLQHERVGLQLQIPEKAVFVSAIPDQLKQVVLNLSLNAIEAMQPSGGVLSIIITPQAAESSVDIAFKDTGPGIPEELLSRLFDPFFSTKDAGLGLGLAICDDIVRGHGGQILVESQAGMGATFTVRLPLPTST